MCYKSTRGRVSESSSATVTRESSVNYWYSSEVIYDASVIELLPNAVSVFLIVDKGGRQGRKVVL